MKLTTGNNKTSKTTIEIIIEKSDGLLWGRVENRGKFMPTPFGKTKEALIENLKKLIYDYQQHEGKTDKAWSKIDIDNLDLEFHYDLQAFFQEHNYLKISSGAEKAGLNPGLLRQYASGVKYPSAEQAIKIENAIHLLADQLKEVSIYA
jgi:hypothetical protein